MDDNLPLLNAAQAAEKLNVSLALLKKMRREPNGRGLAFIRISHRCVRYTRAAILAFQEKYTIGGKQKIRRVETLRI